MNYSFIYFFVLSQFCSKWIELSLFLWEKTQKDISYLYPRIAYIICRSLQHFVAYSSNILTNKLYYIIINVFTITIFIPWHKYIKLLSEEPRTALFSRTTSYTIHKKTRPYRKSVYTQSLSKTFFEPCITGNTLVNSYSGEFVAH